MEFQEYVLISTCIGYREFACGASEDNAKSNLSKYIMGDEPYFFCCFPIYCGRLKRIFIFNSTFFEGLSWSFCGILDFFNLEGYIKSPFIGCLQRCIC